MVKWCLKWLMCRSIFLAFAMTFNVVVAHNMCVLQLDPMFKGL
jgi:hypothetical protein